MEASAQKRVGAITKRAARSGPKGLKAWRFHRAAIALDAIEIRRFPAIV
jgi:hypothetical protein